MFPSKVCRHSVPLFVFTYFQADGVRFVFFCVQVGRRPCWCRLCVVFRNTIAVWAGWATACFPSKVCRHSVLLLVFTYFQADGVRFFVCRWVAVRVGAGFALFFATPLPFGRLGNCMFSVKSLQAQRVFFVCGIFRRKNVLQSVFVDAFLYNIICFVPRLKAV